MLLGACSIFTQHDPTYDLRASFTPTEENIQKVETILDSEASKWNLTIQRDDRDHLEFITQGKPAFYTALLDAERNPVLWVTNAGAGEAIALVAIDFGEMPNAHFESMVISIRGQVSEQLGIDFREVGV
ncbi:MAG: hypothetical protein U5L08_01580 [Xanthomonadales bacterium]|nr:hypothetical protein [Xanthomonadales bacterium]